MKFNYNVAAPLFGSAAATGATSADSETLKIEFRESLSYKEFADEYLYPMKPVVIRGALRQWKAMERWTPEFFKAEFGDLKFTINDTEYGQAGHKPGSGADLSMAQFIELVRESTDENPAPYFRNRDLYDLFPSLKQDIEPLPKYFLPNWLPDHYAVKYVREVLNRGSKIELYIGGSGRSFPVLHYDGNGSHAFLMHIYGEKQFIIYPPNQEQFLYPSPERQNLSLINSVESPDLDRFPLFAKAVSANFVLKAGEILFIPSHWWHTTKMLTPCISLSINVLNQSNWHELVRFVTMRRRNPLEAFAAGAYLTGAGSWRSWRDRNWYKREIAS